MAVHPSHDTRISMGSSLYDEICDRCGATDARGEKALEHPCPNPKPDPDEWNRLHKTLRAVCGSCAKTFIVTGDTEDKAVEPRKTHIRLRSCESGGLYVCEVVCPYCNHTHDLL